MKKITLLLLSTLSVLGLQAQTYQLNYDSIRVGKTAGTGGTSLYGKVYLKNVGLGLVSDSILTVLNGRIRKVPVAGIVPTLGTSAISLGGTANGLSYSAGNYRLHRVTSTTGGVFTTGTDTIAGAKRFNGTLTASGSIYATLYEFGASQTFASRAANANFIYSGTSGLTFSDNTGAVTLASFSNAGAFTLNSLTSGLVQSTAGLLSNASTSDLNTAGVVLTTTNQSIAGVKTFADQIVPTTTSAISAIAASSTNAGGRVITVLGNSTLEPLVVTQQGAGKIAVFNNNATEYAVIRNNGSIYARGQLEVGSLLDGAATDSVMVHRAIDLTVRKVPTTGTVNAVFSTSPTLTTPNIGAATFSTLTGGTASTIAWANTSAGNVTNSMSIRNGGTTTGTGNGINFVTGTALNSARINSVLTSATAGDLVFTTMTASVLGEAGRFLSDKTLSLTGGLTVPAAGTVTFTSAANVYMPTVIREGGTGNAFFQYSTDTRFISLNNAGKVAIRNNANSADNLTLTDAGGLALPQYGAGTLTTDASGNVTATSDERMKNISAFYTVGLDALKNIKPITYKWKTDTKLDTKEFYTGFSAQNVHQNIPQAAGKMANGDLTIQDRPIMATMINAINELNAKIIALEARIKLLEK